MKSYRPWTPTQSSLMPQSPMDWLPEDHLAYFILDLIDELDLGAIERAVQAKDSRGERPYSPRMMTALLLYGYAVGVFSSRKIERATHEDVPFRMLAAGEHPHFTTVNQFRGRHRESLAGLFQQLLEECMSAGLVKLGHVAIDGTKMKANASKHKAMSFDRMNKDEARLSSEIEEMLKHAEAVDAAEDKLYGVGQQPNDLPAELRRREGRRDKIRATRAALQAETAKKRAAELAGLADGLREQAASPAVSSKHQAALTTRAAQHDQASADLDDDDPPAPGVDADLPTNTPPKYCDGSPKPTAQRNFTDPDSRVMMRDGGYLQAFNGQIAVDEAHQIIVAAALSNQSPDAEYFIPMIERVVKNCEAAPAAVTGDNGYFSAANVRAAEAMGCEPFISVGRQRRDGRPEEEPLPHRRTEAHTAMRAVLATERGKAAYARRKATVEPVFGQIKTCRGYRQASFRGLFKNRCEWLFVCATHNLLKLWRALTARAATAALAA